MKHLVWSNEHGGWWGPGKRGYVRIIARAGRYDPRLAAQICADANLYLPAGQEPNEVAVVAPECVGLISSDALLAMAEIELPDDIKERGTMALACSKTHAAAEAFRAMLLEIAKAQTLSSDSATAAGETEGDEPQQRTMT